MQEALVTNDQLPEIPHKRYFTIGEVSHLCSVKTHVLRYWEQEIPALKPMKRRGNRRYYQRDDVLMVRRIRSLLYEQGYTIHGARQVLEGHTPTPTEITPVVEPPKPVFPTPFPKGLDLEQLIRQLEATVKVLKR